MGLVIHIPDTMERFSVVDFHFVKYNHLKMQPHFSFQKAWFCILPIEGVRFNWLHVTQFGYLVTVTGHLGRLHILPIVNHAAEHWGSDILFG